MCVFLVGGNRYRVSLDDCVSFLIGCDESHSSVELVAYVDAD